MTANEARSKRRNRCGALKVGTGDGWERIRTYNFPQSRVTDHRIGKTVPAAAASTSTHRIAGALVEPAACAVRAVHLGQVEPGDVVLVTGAGPIGQLTAMAARAAGAQAVYISEVVPGRRELAGRSLEATVLDPATTNVPKIVREATEGWGADVVFECSASPRAFADALAATRKGGTMVQFGVFTQEVPLHPADLTNYERRIQGNLAYAPRDFDRTIELMGAGQLPAERLVTAEIALVDVVELGFDELIRPDTTHAKIHIRPN